MFTARSASQSSLTDSQLFKTNKSIFSMAKEPPNYPSDSDDMGLESISEPDIDMPEDEDDDEFSLERSASGSGSPDTSVSAQRSTKSEVDTEDDPIDPLTPGAGKTSFDLSAPEQIKREKSGGSDSLSFDDDEDEEWVEAPEFLTPQIPSQPSPPSLREALPPPPMEVFPIATSRSTSSVASKAESTGTMARRKAHRPKKEGSGSSFARTPSTVSPPPVKYPFPGTGPGEAEAEEMDENAWKRGPQMRTAKARDGGRTQSGGVKGVLMDDEET